MAVKNSKDFLSQFGFQRGAKLCPTAEKFITRELGADGLMQKNLEYIQQQFVADIQRYQQKMSAIEQKSHTAPLSAAEIAAYQAMEGTARGMTQTLHVMTADDVREALVILCAGMQIAHEELPAKNHYSPPYFQIGPTFREGSIAAYSRHGLGEGSRDNLILVSPEFFFRYAHSKAMAKQTGAQQHKDMHQDVVKAMMKAGCEELYHAYQYTNPQEHARLVKEMKATYGNDYQAGKRQELESIMSITDPAERARRMNEHYKRNPFEIDAQKFEDRLEKRITHHVNRYFSQQIAR